MENLEIWSMTPWVVLQGLPTMIIECRLRQQEKMWQGFSRGYDQIEVNGKEELLSPTTANIEFTRSICQKS